MSTNDFRQNPLLYLVLTYSGKPLFYSHGTEEEIVRYCAVIQAIVSCFDKQSELRSIESGASQIVVLNATPLILAAVDRQGRGAHQLQSHLELFHAQVLSVLTKQQLEKQFKAKPGIDLRPMLGGTEVFMKALVRDFTNSKPWTWLRALECLELRRSTRAKLNAALLDSRAQSSLLYGLLVTESGLSGVLRPKQHSLHPPDLHLLFSMLFNTPVFQEGEHWVPICFPKFNPNGFLYAYILLLTPPHTYLVLVSPDKHGFFEMQAVGKQVISRLGSPLIESIETASSKGRIDCTNIGVEPIQYFVYKSCSHVQFIQSKCSDTTPQDMQLQFSQLQASMRKNREKLCWYKTEDGSVLGWHTPAFELYCYAKNTQTNVNKDDAKEVVSNAVKALVAWIRKHETRLFIVDGATF